MYSACSKPQGNQPESLPMSAEPFSSVGRSCSQQQTRLLREQRGNRKLGPPAVANQAPIVLGTLCHTRWWDTRTADPSGRDDSKGIPVPDSGHRALPPSSRPCNALLPSNKYSSVTSSDHAGLHMSLTTGTRGCLAWQLRE